MTQLQVKSDQKLLKDSLSIELLSKFQFTKNLLEFEKGFDNLTHICMISLSLYIYICIYIYISTNGMRDKSIITLISSLFQVTRMLFLKRQDFSYIKSTGKNYHSSNIGLQHSQILNLTETIQSSENSPLFFSYS